MASKVNTDAKFAAFMADYKGLAVVEFGAVWCGACKSFAKHFKTLQTQYPPVAFIKLDVDRCAATADAYKVEKMPTFVLLSGGNVLKTLEGADPEAVRSAIDSVLSPLRPPPPAPK
jgi:thioredoxin 1